MVVDKLLFLSCFTNHTTYAFCLEVLKSTFKNVIRLKNWTLKRWLFVMMWKGGMFFWMSFNFKHHPILSLNKYGMHLFCQNLIHLLVMHFRNESWRAVVSRHKVAVHTSWLHTWVYVKTWLLTEFNLSEIVQPRWDFNYAALKTGCIKLMFNCEAKSFILS